MLSSPTVVLQNAAEALRALHFAGSHRRDAFDTLITQPLVRALAVVMLDELVAGPAQ